MHDSQGEAKAVPWGAMVYALLIGLFGAFLVLFTAATLVEGFGSTGRDTGRILERHEGEATVRYRISESAPPNRRFTEVTYPTYSVIGERTDGQAWIAVGEGAYDFAGDHRDDDVAVVSSTLTGRVVALEADGDTWRIRDTGMWILGVGGSILGAGLLVTVEAARRRGRFAVGATRRTTLAAAIPGALVGAFGAAWVLFSPTWGLDVVTTSDRLGGFAAEPSEVEWVIVDSRDFALFGRDELTVAWRARYDEAAAEFAVIALAYESAVGRTRHEYRLVWDGGSAEPIPCPGESSLLALDRIGSGDLEGGLVCFPAGTPAETLEVAVYFGVIPTPSSTALIPVPS